MFEKLVVGLPISDRLWDKVFPEVLIDRSTARNKLVADDTFVVTLRILLHGRVPTGQEVNLVGLKRLNENATSNLHSCSTLQIRVLGEAMFNPAELVGFTEMRDLSRYCAGVAPVRFFVNPQIQSTIVLITTGDHNKIIRACHFIQSLIPRLLPWFFEEHPLTETEIGFLHTLQEKTPDHYIEAVETYVRESNLDQKRMQLLLEGFSAGQIDSQIDRAAEEIKQLQVKMDDALTSYRQYYEAHQGLNFRLLGLEEAKRTAAGDADLLNFFQQNPYVRLDEVAAGRGKLVVTISTTLRFFDQDSYELMSRRPESFLFKHIRGEADAFNNPQRRKLFLDAIFKDELFKVRLQAKYTVGPSIVEAWSQFDVDSDCLPNPHIYYFACLGNYAAPMAEALKGGDYVSALMQCVSSAGSVNINEVVTMENFLQNLFSPRAGNVIEFPNGRTVTPLRALEWLENIQKEGSANE